MKYRHIATAWIFALKYAAHIDARDEYTCGNRVLIKRKLEFYFPVRLSPKPVVYFNLMMPLCNFVLQEKKTADQERERERERKREKEKIEIGY